MQYYLGVDIGTTSAKAVAFSESGKVAASWCCNYKMYHPQPGYSEQDPDEICRAVFEVINNAIRSLKEQPQFIAFSSAMHALILMDKQNKPLTNCIIWADNRAADIAERLKESGWGRYLYEATGVPLHAMSPLCKMLWYKESNPELFTAAHKFIGIKEYVLFQLLNEYIMDASVASATGLFHLEQLSWDQRILNFLEIKEQQLPQVQPISSVYYANQSAIEANALLLSSSTPLVIGGSDGALANLGTGATDDSIAVSIGTSSAARVLAGQSYTDPQMRMFCYYLKDNCYILGGASNNGAVVLEWLRTSVLESSETLDELFQRAAGVEAGSNDLVFIPYILGERAPVWNAKAKGIFWGFDISHTKPHVVRACMEGVIYSVYSIIKLLLDKREVETLYATGGFTQSPLWLQMLADVCNKEVVVSGAAESSALGAVLVGLEALNLPVFQTGEIKACYKPNELEHRTYMGGFRKFESLYKIINDSLKNEAQKLQPDETMAITT